MMKDLVVVRGGGDLATGVICRLHKSGFPVLILECDNPSAIRRKVSFCEAVYQKKVTVEDVTCVKIDDYNQVETVWNAGNVPLLVDPQGSVIDKCRPQYVVDAIIAKKNLGTRMDMAPVTVGLGPGFVAGKDVHYVVETMRGHTLGRIITEGSAIPNTGIPGIIGSYGAERVIHANTTGVIQNHKDIGDVVEAGEVIAHIGDVPVQATFKGILRGIIREGYYVPEGMKIADIDPRESEYENCFTVSDKARCIAGSVLEIVCKHSRS